jgi:hypothetical protein
MFAREFAQDMEVSWKQRAKSSGTCAFCTYVHLYENLDVGEARQSPWSPFETTPKDRDAELVTRVSLSLVAANLIDTDVRSSLSSSPVK